MSEWRPIETAPKDGSAVLVAFRNTDDHEEWMAIVKWNSRAKDEFGWDDLSSFECHNATMATHWMALPPLPTPTPDGT